MYRLEAYFNRYTTLSQESKDFLSSHGRIRTFQKGSYFMGQHELKHKWCFLLEGLIGYEILDRHGKMQLERLGTINQYFVGTKHAYSPNGATVAVRFLQNSTTYTISNIYLQTGIRQYPELSQVYHILKQHSLDALHVFIRLNKLDRIVRLAYLYQQFPHVKEQLTVRQTCSLLGYTNTKQYYQALEYYYETK